MSCDDENVKFKWRDYSDENKEKIMTLGAHEFIRRYLSHVLPNGYMRVRSFGILANACKAKNLAIIRQLLSLVEEDNRELTVTALPSIPQKEMKTRLVQFEEKPFINTIASDDVDTLKPIDNLLVKSVFSSPKGTDDADTAVVSVKKKESTAELMKRVTGIDIERCKHCQIGRLEKMHIPVGWDTS